MDGDDMFHTIHPPISELQMRLYMDDNGRIIYLNQFYLDVYLNGLEHSLRKVGWRILLSVCPADTTGQERFHLLDIKAQQYATLKENWKKLYVMGLMSEHQLSTLASISIDVVRTDWKEDYYRSVGNHHRVCQLFDILATYCIHHPNIGYCQGMSDLASPLLVVQSDEALAYLSFCALMQRVKFKFGDTQQSILINNMQDLHDLLTYTDGELAQFFREHNLANMYFTQRWFVLELKREFNFDESLRMFESQWAALCLVKNNSLTEIETCNSKSEGYLVLTDGTSNLCMPNSSFTSTNSLNWFKLCCRLEKKGCTTVFNPGMVRQNHPSSASSPPQFIPSDAHFSCKLSKEDDHSGNPQQTSSETLITETQFEIISNESLLDFTNSVKKQSLHLTPTKRLSSFSIENEPIHIRTNVTHLRPPNQFGQEYKEVIMLEIKEPGDIIQFYQQQSGKHNSSRILYRAKKLFNKYLEENNFQFFS
ncbi:unnamed protein product [Schistosoma mattheei]|uniref:Rab-GAP TBC domain-containing protein n=1 Tax=Schistosoma mattheei TaxID=31246 RepID=A0AA85BYS3_9TREM|nr:unnamed protein product [Schistosoma mattheei]